MFEQDSLTPQDRELEHSLRLLRPQPVRFDLARAAAARLAVRRRRLRALAAAAMLGGVAAWAAWQASDGEPPSAGNVSSVENPAAHTAPVEPPTQLVYRRAMMRSAAELDALLDLHASAARAGNSDVTPVGIVLFWHSDLHTSSRQPSSGAL